MGLSNNADPWGGLHPHLTPGFEASKFSIFEPYSFSFLFTARNSSCRKVMFSQACAIPFVHGGVGFPACITDHMTREVCIPGGLHPVWVCIGGGVVCIQVGLSRPHLGYYGIRSKNRQYASYWNAFLFFTILIFFIIHIRMFSPSLLLLAFGFTYFIVLGIHSSLCCF